MIAMSGLSAEPPELRRAMLAAAQRVIESGWYVLGNELTSFEKSWAAACGLPHGIGVGNGMDAIEIILRALDLGPGDEVITTPMTAFASILAILRVGATPVLADIDLNTALLSLPSAERCIGPKTRALLLVHLYGQIDAMDDWCALCDRHGISLVEDCAQAHAASWHGRAAGSLGVAGAYSFYPTKNLGGLGDGGMIVTADPHLAQRARRLRNYGQAQRYQHPEIGLNSRLDELQAALLSERLNWLPAFTARRRAIATAYRRGIHNPSVQPLATLPDPLAQVHHQFVVTCKRRDTLQAWLTKCGVETLIHYPIPIHWQVPCLGVPCDPCGLPNAERHAATCLSLPCHPHLTDMEVVTVVAAINAFEAL